MAEITAEFLAELKEKAEKATQGPWNICAATIAKNSFKSIIIHGNEQVAIVKTPRGLGRPGSTKDIRERDASYIAAANPSVILALLEDYEGKREALYGMFLLVDKLKACMNLDKDASVEETIQGAISLINDLNGQLSGLMNANGEAQEIIAELKREKAKLERELDGLCHDETAKELKIGQLEKEVDWFALTMAEKDCSHGCPSEEALPLEDCMLCWRKAARKAVAEQKD